MALFMMPPLSCLLDPAGDIRFAACEALYNIAKVARVRIMSFFPDVFDALCKVCTLFQLKSKITSSGLFLQ
jgi:vacuole morphology and inheritance protein 14